MTFALSSRRWLLAALLVALSTTAAVASPRDQIRAKRAEARAAIARTELLGRQLEPVIQRYDQATLELATVRRAIAENERQIALLRANVATARAALDQQLAAAYRQGDPDALAAVLGSGSISDMLAGLDFMKRSETRVGGLIGQLQHAKVMLGARERRLRVDRKRVVRLVAEAAAQRERIRANIAEQQRLVRGLRSEIVQLQAQERARQRRLAEEARQRLRQARQAAAAAAAANPDPAIGGSGASSDAGGSSSGGSASAGEPGSTSGSGSSGGTIPPPPAGNSSIGVQAVQWAMTQLGKPYVWGAAGPGSYDCSGLTMWAYAHVGISLSHFTGSQWNEGARVSSMGDLQPGDLVFFDASLGHMGMYIGNGQMIHAPHTGDVVKISTISSGYYASQFQGGVRPY